MSRDRGCRAWHDGAGHCAGLCAGGTPRSGDGCRRGARATCGGAVARRVGAAGRGGKDDGGGARRADGAGRGRAGTGRDGRGGSGDRGGGREAGRQDGAFRARWRRSVAAEAVLATNTSSLSVASIAAGLAHPDRVMGLHFFNPAPVMQLVELVAPPGDGPGRSALARASDRGRGQGGDRRARQAGVHRQPLRPPLLWRGAGAAARRPHGGRDRRGDGGGRLSTWPLLADRPDRGGYQPCGDRRPGAGDGRPSALSCLCGVARAGGAGRSWPQDGRGFCLSRCCHPCPCRCGAIALRIEAMLANEGAWLLAEGGTTPRVSTRP